MRRNRAEAIFQEARLANRAHPARGAIARRRTLAELTQRKGTAVPLVCATAYSAPMAALLDDEVDLIIVSDALAKWVYGLDSALPVTLDMMIAHGAAVVRATSRAMVAVDLPFGSYQDSPASGYRSAARVLAETEADAVVLKGGAEMAETVRFLVERSVDVIGHAIGPVRQSRLAGLAAGGQSDAGAGRLVADAEAIAAAGACALVVECVPSAVAAEIRRAIPVPTIGLGSGPDCDGQLLILNDMLGLGLERPPRYARRYADLAPLIMGAVSNYARDVRTRKFPGPNETDVVSTDR
jgi:3-methyl-2-oxobutanoate hydroxymethyltransferase